MRVRRAGRAERGEGAGGGSAPHTGWLSVTQPSGVFPLRIGVPSAWWPVSVVVRRSTSNLSPLLAVRSGCEPGPERSVAVMSLRTRD